ncbi:uncharacterized protein [Euwallacea similis]|uniref:uncharacterized protein n=1 Tax=Euwallacea similis TaxID=1736056 RepID=UPI00344B9087
MAMADSSPNVGLQQENVQNSLEHKYKEFFDAVDEVYSLLQSQNALQIKQLSMLASKLKELKNIPIPQGKLPEFINCVLNYIEIVLTFISTLKDYSRQKELVLYFLYMIPYFFDKPEVIREFMKDATVKILELFLFGNFSIISNRELLGTFNSIAIKSTKEARTAVAEKTLYYMYKLIDSLSTYGDYGLQADIMETLFRIYGSHIRGKKIKYDLLPGSAELSEELTTNISSDNFDLHVRHWLNKFNQNSSLIFTLPCQQLIFGNVAVKNIQEFGPITWLDFDLKEQIIGFYMEGKDSSWNRVIFFARNISNVNVNRQFTTYNKATTVTMILSKPCISEAMDSQDFCNSLSKELKIVISNEERDKITKLISHVLPKIFGDVFTHSSSRVSQKLKQVYKPLRMKVSKNVSRRRSVTDVENLNVLSRSTTSPIHTPQGSISLPEIKYSCLAKESVPSTSRSLFSYSKEHVQLAKRSEQNGESCHNCSFVLTEFSRTDVASDRASLIPSRNSEMFSSKESSHNATHISRVQSHGNCQRSHSCSLIAENVEFKHSEMFSSSPVKRSTHSSQLQLIENTFCSSQFDIEDLKGNKTSVFKASEEIVSDKYETAVEDLIQLELEDALHYQEIPRFDIVERKSKKETVTIDKKVTEESDVFPTIKNVPLATPTNDLSKDTTSQDLFAITQSSEATHKLSVNNSKYIFGMHTPENKKPETQTSSEDRNLTELSMTVNIGVASDKLYSELDLPADKKDKVQSSEIVEVFIDLTKDKSDVEKHVEKSNIESQLKNISVDADAIQNITNAEVLPILNNKGLLGVLDKSSKYKYVDKELAAPIDGKDRVQNSEIVEVFIDLTEDEPDVEKQLDKPDIEMQLENMDLDVDVIQNVTDAEGMPVLNTQELLGVLGKTSTHESIDKGAMSPKTSEPSPAVIVINDKLNVPAKCVQKKPRRLIKMGKKLFRLDNLTTKSRTSDEGPTIKKVNSKTADASMKQTRAAVMNTLEEVQAINSIQKKIDQTAVSVNSKVMDNNLTESPTQACVTVKDHLEDVIQSVQKNVDPDEFGTKSSKQIHNTFKSHIEEIIDSVARNAAESSISLNNETDSYFVKKSPKQTLAEEKKEWHYNCSAALTNFAKVPLQNLDELITRVDINKSGRESQKHNETRIIHSKKSTVEEPAEKTDIIITDNVDPNCYNPPQIERNFMSLRLSPRATPHPTENSESDFDFLQKTRKSQQTSQESRVSDLILKKSAKRLVSNDSIEALHAEDSEDKIHPKCNDPPQVEPTLKQLSIIVNRMVIPHPIESSQSDFGFVQKTYMSETASSELGMNNFIVKKAARPLASDDSMEALAAEQGQKVEDCPKKSKALNASFNSLSKNLKKTNFMEHVDNSSIVSGSPTIVTTLAAIHYANTEGGSPKEITDNSPSVIAAHSRLNTEEQVGAVTPTCNDYDVIKTINNFSKVQRNSIINGKEVDTRLISNEGVYAQKSPPKKSNSSKIQKVNSPVLTINKSPTAVLNRLDLKTKKTCENYIETDSGIDEILHLWDKKQDSNKNEKESDKTGANSRRVLYKEGSFSYLDEMELTRTTPEMSQTPEPIEVNSKKKKTKRKQQKYELLSTKETTRKHESLRAKKKRQSIKPPSLLYDPVASKNLREIFEKTCENIFNKTAQNCRQVDPKNRTFGFGDLDVAVRGVEESRNSRHTPISPAKIMSPKSPQLPELNTPPDLIWPEIETMPRPAINVLQHIVVPSQTSKRTLNFELPPPLESTPPKKIRLDENILPSVIPVVSSHTSEITDRALSIITYVCTLANQRNEAASTNLGMIMDFIDRLKQ